MRGECTKLDYAQYRAIGEEIAHMLIDHRMTREEILDDIGISVYQYQKCLKLRYGDETATKLFNLSKRNVRLKAMK